MSKQPELEPAKPRTLTDRERLDEVLDELSRAYAELRIYRAWYAGRKA